MSFMQRPVVASPMPSDLGLDTVLSTLIASRICHDLASPMGAVTNGVELLELSGTADGDELALLKSSIAAANGRLELLRIAFGKASSEQALSPERIARTLALISKDARITYAWAGETHIQRQELQVALLAGMCIELALPRGGEIVLSNDDGAWTLRGTGPQVVFDKTVWSEMSSTADLNDFKSNTVQLALLPRLAERLGRTVDVDDLPDAVLISF